MTSTEIETMDNEIRDIETTDLSGEAIERLLYEAGFDSELKVGAEGIPVLEIRGDDTTLILSEVWADSGNWYIDPKGIVLDLMSDDTVVNTVFPTVTTEAELVASVENLVEEQG